MAQLQTVACPVVGAFFRPPAASLLKCLPAGTDVFLVREPGNEYDANAIAVHAKSVSIPKEQHEALESALASQGLSLEEVLSQESWHIGYVPKGTAAQLHGAKLPPTAKLGFTGEGKPQIYFTVEEG